MARRIAIVGTAPSWKLVPWTDPSIEIWSLNDAHSIKGFQRADRWYDIHPMDKFYIVPVGADGKQRMVYAHTVPPDKYVRPANHLDWLASQPFPKFLHPDFATQYPKAATWPNVHAFPKAAIEAQLGTYFTSSPSWMLAHALVEGVRDIEIYGIHLSTEHEYIEQRPGFEFLCGMLLGAGKRSIIEADGKRIYETESGRLVLPVASPVLSAKQQYAFQPSPRRQLEPLKWELHKVQAKITRRYEALKQYRAWKPLVRFEEPKTVNGEEQIERRWVPQSTLVQEMIYFEALASDWQEQMRRVTDPTATGA